VLFSHDTVRALDCLVDLVNSATSATTEDELPDLESVREYVARHDLRGVGALTPDDLIALHGLRSAIAPVLDATDAGAAAAAVNALVADTTVTPRLTDHDGYPWHLHYFTPGSTLAERLRIECGMALAHLVATEERTRLSRCAAPDCDRVLVDLSRNRSKRYCDARTCGNRLHVAAYRERRRAATGA
jgi:predicted RNA-binding Zn ribbon-like protein